MPLILSEENTKDMSNERLLEIALQEYACPENWKSREKEFSHGQFVDLSPWTLRDRGFHAQQALDIVQRRRATQNARGPDVPDTGKLAAKSSGM